MQVCFIAPHVLGLHKICSGYVFEAIRWTCFNTVRLFALTAEGETAITCPAPGSNLQQHNKHARSTFSLQLFVLFVVQGHNTMPSQITGRRLLASAVAAARTFVAKTASRIVRITGRKPGAAGDAPPQNDLQAQEPYTSAKHPMVADLPFSMHIRKVYFDLQLSPSHSLHDSLCIFCGCEAQALFLWLPCELSILWLLAGYPSGPGDSKR